MILRCNQIMLKTHFHKKWPLCHCIFLQNRKQIKKKTCTCFSISFSHIENVKIAQGKHECHHSYCEMLKHFVGTSYITWTHYPFLIFIWKRKCASYCCTRVKDFCEWRWTLKKPWYISSVVCKFVRTFHAICRCIFILSIHVGVIVVWNA